MAELGLFYGDRKVDLDIPESINYTIIKPQKIEFVKDIKIDYFAKNLIQKKILDLGKPIKEILIGVCINDKTRPVPYDSMLPDFLAYIKSFGIENNQIIFFIANGTHIPESIETLTYIPETIRQNFSIQNHDCLDNDNLIFLGNTSRSTPVWINKIYFECDIKIAIGNIEPHHFAGYSGAVKSVAIGLAGKKTILENHKLLVEDLSQACVFDDNPLRQDIEEIGKMTRVDFCLNAVKDPDKNLVKVLWASPADVIKEAIPTVDRLAIQEISDKFDIVIASAGGYPKDINLYQAQKAITNAAKITKDGGLVLLVAECIEGVGSQGYEQYMNKFCNPTQIIDEYNAGVFDIGPHKALQFAFILERVSVALYSSISPEIVRKLLLEPVKDISEYISGILRKDPKSSLAIMTNAVITIPREKR